MKKFLVIAMVLFVGLLAFGADKVVQVKGDVTTATAGQVTVDPIKAYTAKIEANRARKDEFAQMNLAWSLNNTASAIIDTYQANKSGDLKQAKAYLTEAQSLIDKGEGNWQGQKESCQAMVTSNLSYIADNLPKETVTTTVKTAK